MQPPVEAVWQMCCSGQHEMSWNPSATLRPEHGAYMNLSCLASESWQQSQYCMCLLTHGYPRSGSQCFRDTMENVQNFQDIGVQSRPLCNHRPRRDCKARMWDTGKLLIMFQNKHGILWNHKAQMDMALQNKTYVTTYQPPISCWLPLLFREGE